MSEPLVDAVVDPQPVTEISTTEIQPVETAAAVQSPLEDAKSAFSKFVAFVEHGIEKLGSEAEAELVTLAKKYL
ncbi:Ig domain protein group 1 domain protein [Rahnella woolbedingensis]|nr:Ig domain protein group 1 domain protein [Rahnella woolbedingensis]